MAHRDVFLLIKFLGALNLINLILSFQRSRCAHSSIHCLAVPKRNSKLSGAPAREPHECVHCSKWNENGSLSKVYHTILKDFFIPSWFIDQTFSSFVFHLLLNIHQKSFSSQWLIFHNGSKPNAFRVQQKTTLPQGSNYKKNMGIPDQYNTLINQNIFCESQLSHVLTAMNSHHCWTFKPSHERAVFTKSL